MSKLHGVPDSDDPVLRGMHEIFGLVDGSAPIKVERRHMERQDPKKIRENLGLSQAEFSGKFGIPVATLQSWEQGKRQPDQSVNVLLFLIKEMPVTVSRKIQKGLVKVER